MADTPPAEFSDDAGRRSGGRCAPSAPTPAACAARPRGSGLLSLPLLALAVATGLWLYTIALRDDRPGSALAIWLHVAVSRARARCW